MELNRLNFLLGIGQSNDNNDKKNQNYTIPNKRLELLSPDTLFINNRNNNLNNSISNFSFLNNNNSSLSDIKKIILNSANYEWRSGVRETNGDNRSTRIDQYARNSSFRPGGGWCGFFVAFNYSQAGFKYPSSLAGMEKARAFFLYRSYTKSSKDPELEQLRLEHKQKGNERKFFMLEESTSINHIRNHKNKYSHYNIEANTFKYYNLPIESGDVVVFDTGKPGGHVGLVISYNKNNGKLITIEGNTTGKMFNGKIGHGVVAYKEYDLTNPDIRKKIAGFGRPSINDFK